MNLVLPIIPHVLSAGAGGATQDMLSQLTDATLSGLSAFVPELLLIGGILAMLIIRTCQRSPSSQRVTAFCFVALALIMSFYQWAQFGEQELSNAEIFTGLLAFDRFTVFFKIVLLLVASLTILLTIVTQTPRFEDSVDFYTLLLGAVLGMMVMVGANHLLMVFIGIEMASLPSYALAGFLKRNRRASEASLKYVVYGSAAAGVMLYGMSFLIGYYGTGHLPTLANRIVETGTVEAEVETFSKKVQRPHLQEEQGQNAEHHAKADHAAKPGDAGALAKSPSIMLKFSLLLVMVGFAFKIAAVPFHFWCPDVFEGATSEVAAFLSVASKGAALALVGRFALVLTNPSSEFTADIDIEAIQSILMVSLGVFGAITATYGNLAAFTQNNLKRLLAYSSIAHAGYIMMGLATLSILGLEAMMTYIVVYAVMNLGAFGVVSLLNQQIQSEDLRDYAGLGFRLPVLGICMAIFMFSLTGIPPFAGFSAKFKVFAAIFHGAQQSHGLFFYTLLGIAGLNTVFSLFYYVRVLKVMYLDAGPEGGSTEPLPIPIPGKVFIAAMAALLLVMFVWWQLVEHTASSLSSMAEVTL